MATKGTGVFATAEEVERVKAWLEEARRAPAILALGRVDVPYEAEDAAMARLDALAVAHGLPEPAAMKNGRANHYGMSLEGEFTVLEDVHLYMASQDSTGSSALCGRREGEATTHVPDVTCPACLVATTVAAEVEASALEKREPTLRERMRVRSQMPDLDDVFVPELDFPGSVVRPGEYGERSFAFGRECRLVGVRKPKGLTLVALTLKVGVDFRAVRRKDDGTDPPHAEYEGRDCLVYKGEEIKRGEWRKKRLAPEMPAGLYLLVRNDTEDDLRFEGTLTLEEDRVPEPDHEDV